MDFEKVAEAGRGAVAESVVGTVGRIRPCRARGTAADTPAAAGAEHRRGHKQSGGIKP